MSQRHVAEQQIRLLFVCGRRWQTDCRTSNIDRLYQSPIYYIWLYHVYKALWVWRRRLTGKRMCGPGDLHDVRPSKCCVQCSGTVLVFFSYAHLKAQVGVVWGLLPSFVTGTGIRMDSVRRWNLWLLSAGLYWLRHLQGGRRGRRLPSCPSGAETQTGNVQISRHEHTICWWFIA